MTDARMEGISNGTVNQLIFVLNVNAFWLCLKTFTDDVRLIFAEKELQIVVEKQSI